MARTFKILVLILCLTAFAFARPASCQTPINCGEVISGSLSVKGERDTYTFSASANDTVTIRADSGNLCTRLELYAPDGAKVAEADDQINKKLATSGIYTILFRDCYNNKTGEYILTWHNLNNPCAAVLRCGQGVNGTLGKTNTEPHWRFYSFSASAGDSVAIRACALSKMNLYLELYAPDGQNIVNASSLINKTLPLTGKYTVVITDIYNLGGEYSLLWARLNTPCAPLINCGSISKGRYFKVYSFTVSSNDSVTIRTATASGGNGPPLELYAPDGAKVAESQGQIDKKLTAPGTYTILAGNTGDIGNYSIVWQKTNNPCSVVPVSFDTLITGTVNNFVEIDAYQFTVNPNDKVVICSNPTSGVNFNCYLQIYDSAGNKLAQGEESLKRTFTTGGTFYLFIADANYDDTGTYKLMLKKGNVTCADADLTNPQVSLITPQAGEVLESGSTYPITWSSSDNFDVTKQSIRLSTDSGTTYPDVLASGLSGSVHSYNWHIPATLSTVKARVKVIARDAQGNIGEDANNSDFIIINTSLPAASKDANYEYDKLQWLKKSASSAGDSSDYTYDSLGNRLKIKVIKGQTPP